MDNHRMTICVLRVQILLFRLCNSCSKVILDIVVVIHNVILNVAHSTVW